MKIRTIVGLLLVLALVLGSTGVAAAQTQTRDDWVDGEDGELYPPDWGTDGLPPCGVLPSGNGPSWLER